MRSSKPTSATEKVLPQIDRNPPKCHSQGGSDVANTRRDMPLPSLLNDHLLSRGGSSGKVQSSSFTVIAREDTMIVSSTLADGAGSTISPLPSAWTQQRVNPSMITLKESEETQQLTKVGWENQIAKHILSLFATSKALRDIKEGSDLLQFVDTSGGGSAFNDVLDGQEGDMGSAQPYEATTMDAVPHPIPQSTQTKRKARRRKHSNTVVKSSANTRLPQEIQDSKSYQKVANVMMRIREEAGAAASNPGQEPSAAGKKDSYRISNTIKMKDGREIVLRGSPRCFPIWFSSSGDVFADWTALPGASKLQAHLNTLYENKKYTEYVDVVETSIQENWRRVIYGEEDFTIGSFGKNAATGKSSDDGPVRGTSSSSGRRASSTRQAGKRTTDEGTSQFGSPLGWRQTDSGVVPVELRGAPLMDHGAATARIATCGPSHEQLKGLWQQLIVTALAMGVLAMEQKHFDKGLSLFHQAERWTKNDELLDSSAIRKHCRAHCKDAMACYFFKVGKPFSAVSYAEAAMELYEGVRDMEGVAVCLLHLSAIYSQLGEFKKAHKLIFEFLAMVEGGRLSDAAPSPKQLCLVAVGYHNLGRVRKSCLLFLRRCPMSLTYLPSHRIPSAVVQLKLNVPDLACKNSQNARKIARLCLSYSNRWIDVFRYTHSLAVADIKWELRTKQLADLSPMQISLIAELAEALFDPDFDALHKGDAAIVT